MTYVIYAPSVHSGGGFELLKDLLSKISADAEVICFLDNRIKLKVPLPSPQATLFWVEPTVTSRLSAEFKLRHKVKNGQDVLVFSGIPPLVPNKGTTTLFLQNRILIADISTAKFKLKTRVRLGIEKLALYLSRDRISRYFVQTQSMSVQLADWLGKMGSGQIIDRIQILPFHTDQLPALDVKRSQHTVTYDFCYVADGAPHKNHHLLLDAFVKLAKDDIFPKLALTLGERDTELIHYIEDLVTRTGIKVTNLGFLSQEDVKNLYLSSKAMVFPSLLESFGLPLIEATRMHLPILCSEKDYARDVCTPVETFDPTSARSIERAIRRFLRKAEPLEAVKTTDHFLNAFLSSSKPLPR
ncbi:glycosyltransferase [Sulfitobacter pontiacus]|uniref:glycosyltransferase n=1 Tax=Sulfitobacter pontiacus TaxID=60137 RepID=UPI0030EBCE4E